MLSLVGIIVGLALLIFLAFRGKSLLWAAPVCALLVAWGISRAGRLSRAGYVRLALLLPLLIGIAVGVINGLLIAKCNFDFGLSLSV